MAYNYLLKIIKSLGGRATAYTGSNSYNIESPSRLGQGFLTDSIDRIVEAEMRAHYDAVHFLRALLTPVVQTPTEIVQNTFISKELEGVGFRPLGVKKLLPENVCLGVKRDAAIGRGGMLYYRWCLAEEDVTAGADHNYILASPITFDGGNIGQDTIISLLNQSLPDGKLIMPNKPLDTFDYNRDVERHRLAGVVFKQAHNTRKSADQALGDGGERKIRELEKSLVDMLAGGVFSLLDAGSKAVALAAMNQIREILLAMPPRRAMKIVLNEALRGLPGGPSV